MLPELFIGKTVLVIYLVLFAVLILFIQLAFKQNIDTFLWQRIFQLQIQQASLTMYVLFLTMRLNLQTILRDY